MASIQLELPYLQPARCECGCGREVRVGRRFISGHNPTHQKKRTPEEIKASIERAKIRRAIWHEENRDRRLLQAKERKKQIKIEVLTYYGMGECKCLMCGYETLAALTLDHINDDGYNESRSGHELYQYLRKTNFPTGYQTLCMNCQYIKREANGNSSCIRSRTNSRRC